VREAAVTWPLVCLPGPGRALEATGPAGLLLDAVQRAAGLLFASPLPAGAGFSLDNSRSYAQWLYHQPGAVPGEPPEV
jgi:hypothetical protein